MSKGGFLTSVTCQFWNRRSFIKTDLTLGSQTYWMTRSLNTLNVLHLLLVLSSGACLYFAWQETRDKVVKLDRLFRAPLFAVIVGLILMTIQTVGAKHPTRFFLAAFFAGVALGPVRGFTITLSIGSSCVCCGLPACVPRSG